MKIKPLATWTVAEIATGASAIALGSGSLGLHGYWSYFGVSFWEYVGAADILQASAGIIVTGTLAAAVAAGLFAAVSIIMHAAFIAARLLRLPGVVDRSELVSLCIAGAVFGSAVGLFVSYTTEPYLARILSGYAITVVLLLAYVLSSVRLFVPLARSQMVRASALCIMLGPLIFAPVFGYRNANRVHMAALGIISVPVEHVRKEALSSPSLFPSKEGYFVIGQLRDNVFMLDRGRGRVVAVLADEILKREAPMPVLPGRWLY